MKKLLFLFLVTINFAQISEFYKDGKRYDVAFDTLTGRHINDVYIQDQSTRIVDLYLCNFLNNATLAVNAKIDTNKINLVAGHNFVTGNTICIKEGIYFYQGEVINVATNVITLDMPLDYAFTTAATVERTSNKLNVDGSTINKTFRVKPNSTSTWDITRMIVFISDNAAMDDGKFGGLTALTNGIVVRKKDGTYYNLFDVKKNGDFRLRAYDVEYVDATLGASGTYGLAVRRTFAGQEKNGVVIRLDGSTEDEFQVIVRDDLTGLTDFRIVIQGHIVE